MGKSKRQRTVEVAVENQCMAIRTLTQAMRVHADSLGWMNKGEFKVIEGWAQMLDLIGIALGEAVRDKDVHGLRRLWHTVVPLAIPLLAVQGMAADSFSLWDHFATKPAVAQAAMQVVAIAKADQDLISEWQGDLAHSAKPPPDHAETERLRREIDGLEIGISEMEGELKAMSPDADPERLDFQRRMRLEIEEKIRDYSIRARDLKVQLRELQSPQRDQSR